jgi:hypothetical protein
LRGLFLLASDVGHFFFEGAGDFGGFVDFGGADLLYGQAFDPTDIGITKIGAFDVGFRKIGAVEFGAHEFGIDQICVTKIGLGKVGFAEVGPHQIGAAEIGTAQVAAGEVGASQDMPGKVSPVQTLLIQLRQPAVGLYGFEHWLSITPSGEPSDNIEARSHCPANPAIGQFLHDPFSPLTPMSLLFSGSV